MVLLSGKALSKGRNNERNSLDGVLWLAIYLLHLTDEACWQLSGVFLERKFRKLSRWQAIPLLRSG